MSNPAGVIDIGSNTVLLTAGRLAPSGTLEVLLECHDVGRLSEGLQDGKALLPAAKDRVLKILKVFQEQARAQGIEELTAAGTAAFRRASDGAQFAETITKQLGIPTKILKGEEEANYSYLSALKDFGPGPLGMIDIGGGSTEVVWGKGNQLRSLPVGTVRLLETFVSGHPISDPQWQEIKANIRRILAEGLPNLATKNLTWVAVAATPTALANLMQALPQYEPDKVHGFPIHKSALKETVEKLRKLSLADREDLPGMPPKRAELLPLGGLILLEILSFVKTDRVLASHHGLRYGLLWEALKGSIEEPPLSGH